MFLLHQRPFSAQKLGYIHYHYLLTPCSTVLFEKLTGSQLVKKFPAFYGTQRFITAFTSARQLSLSWVRSIQSISPHTTFRRSILILSSHLLLGLPSAFFPSGFPTKILYTPPLSLYVLHAQPTSFFHIHYHYIYIYTYILKHSVTNSALHILQVLTVVGAGSVVNSAVTGDQIECFVTFFIAPWHRHLLKKSIFL